MALSERSRSALYRGFSAVVDDEEAVAEMLSFFPARDVEEAVTKEFVRAELAETELRLGGELRAEMRRMIWVNIGSLVAFAGVIIAAVRI
ncbi:MAG: hypothetical protein R2735_13180 [Microthrixaceae bacterium]